MYTYRVARGRFTIVALLCALAVIPALSASSKMAIVVSASSKLQDIKLADLAKLCKGAGNTWPDGKAFTLVIRDPEAPGMLLTMQKLFGTSPAEWKSAIAKLNETRPGTPVVRVVKTDEEIFSTVAAISGAVGIVDVYSINSSIKVLRVDGKLPFDLGYGLK